MKADEYQEDWDWRKSECWRFVRSGKQKMREGNRETSMRSENE